MTRCWREQDSNHRSPVAKGCFRFGEGEAGKGHGDDKRRSQHGEYLKLEVGGFELLVAPLEIHHHGSPERRSAPKAFGHYMHQSSPLRHRRAATLAALKMLIDNPWK